MAPFAPFVGCHVLAVCFSGATVDGTPEIISFQTKYRRMEFHVVSFFMVWNDEDRPSFMVFDVDNILPRNNLSGGALHGKWRGGNVVHVVCLFQSGRIIGYGLPCAEQETTGLPSLVPPLDGAFAVVACLPFPIPDQPPCHGDELFDPCGHVWLLFLAIHWKMAPVAVPKVHYDGTDFSDDRGFFPVCGGNFLQIISCGTMPCAPVKHDLCGCYLLHLFLSVCAILLPTFQNTLDRQSSIITRINP